MESFASFYKRGSRTDTPNTREHQQIAVRSMDRKHLNQVPRSRSQQAKHPLIDQLIKNGQSVNQKPLSKIQAEQILRAYNIPFSTDTISKQINRTGITVHYSPKDNQYFLTKT